MNAARATIIGMPIGDVETYFEDGQWHNRREGLQTEPMSSHRIKREAVAQGRKYAIALAVTGQFQPGRDTVEHVVRNEDGTIADRNTYPRANDPRQSRG